MPKQLTPEQAERFWDFADKNKDGVLTVGELKSSVNACKRANNEAELNDQQICCMFLDITKQGVSKPITKEKYMHEILQNRENDLVDLFKKFDKDGSGSLSHSEIVALCIEAKYGPDSAADIIAAADTNNDGVVSLQEFKKCTC